MVGGRSGRRRRRGRGGRDFEMDFGVSGHLVKWSYVGRGFVRKFKICSFNKLWIPQISGIRELINQSTK